MDKYWKYLYTRTKYESILSKIKNTFIYKQFKPTSTSTFHLKGKFYYNILCWYLCYKKIFLPIDLWPFC